MQPVPSVQIVGKGANWEKRVFFARCSSHLSPLSERLEQATVDVESEFLACRTGFIFGVFQASASQARPEGREDSLHGARLA